MGQQSLDSDYQAQKLTTLAVPAVASGVPEAAGRVAVGSFLFLVTYRDPMRVKTKPGRRFIRIY